MTTTPGNGMQFFIQHPGRDVDVAHYFRQIAISRRRHAPWINRFWCLNQRTSAKATSWKH